jgi:CRP-like cAMP-binding protein
MAVPTTQINLRALPSLRDYSNAELKVLATVAPAREFQTGTVICREGTAGQSCFLLATGEVKVTKKTNEGDQVLATLRAGAIVGQIALVDRAPRSASVVAAQPTIALELTRDVFERLLRASSSLALRFQEQIAIAGIRQLRLANQRLQRILTERATASTAIAAQPVAQQPVNKEALLTVQAALSEWDMSLDDLDQVQVAIPRGQVGADEVRARVR